MSEISDEAVNGQMESNCSKFNYYLNIEQPIFLLLINKRREVVIINIIGF